MDLMEEKISGFEMQVETLVEFWRGFEQMMKERPEVAEGKTQDLQLQAGLDNCEGKLRGELNGPWKYVLIRTR